MEITYLFIQVTLIALWMVFRGMSVKDDLLI